MQFLDLRRKPLSFDGSDDAFDLWKRIAGCPHFRIEHDRPRFILDAGFEGDAVQVTDENLLRQLAAAWTRKWDGQWKFGVSDGAFQHPDDGGEALVFAVEPAKVLAFAKGSFSHTRHRF